MNNVQILILLCVCLTGCIIQGFYISADCKKQKLPAIILKTSASLIFAGIGFVGAFFFQETLFTKLISIGLILGAIGDFALNLRYFIPKKDFQIFLAGVIAFFSGHICYMISLVIRSEKLLPGVICGAVLAVVINYILLKLVTLDKHSSIIAIIYISFIVVLASIAISNALVHQIFADTVQMLGILLFVTSDLLLIYHTFGKDHRIFWSVIVLTLYYVGQLLIALRTFIY